MNQENIESGVDDIARVIERRRRDDRVSRLTSILLFVAAMGAMSIVISLGSDVSTLKGQLSECRATNK